MTKNTAATTTNAAGITRLTGVINDEIEKQRDLLDRMDQLTKMQQEQLAQQQQILDSIAGKRQQRQRCAAIKCQHGEE